jgi:hypothetical protein
MSKLQSLWLCDRRCARRPDGDGKRLPDRGRRRVDTDRCPVTSLDRERGHGPLSNLSGLESILAVVTPMPIPPEPRRLKPALNIAGCLALLHAVHVAKPQKTRRRKI